MRAGPGFAGRLAAGFLAALTLMAAASPAEQAARRTLRNEDVVRMLVGGQSVRAIVDAIAAAEPEFDLSEEMLEELRRAGVPPPVLRAMRERQAAADRASAREEAATEPAPAVPAGPVLTLQIERAPGVPDGVPEALLYPVLLDDTTATALQVGDAPGERAVSDLAFFIACRTADHVPDQWRMRSPLGRDFVSMPRHGMLLFHAGATRFPAREALEGRRGASAPRGPDGKPVEVLRLELPATFEVEVTEGVAHDLILGVAARVGERYLALDLDGKDGVVVGPEGLTLPGTARTVVRGSVYRLDVAFTAD
jgi:hypothetical protein